MSCRFCRKILIIVIAADFAISAEQARTESVQGCKLEPGQEVAFARVSPLRVFETPDFRSHESLDVDFARAFPVLADEGARVRLCIGDRPLWVARSHVAKTHLGQWAVTQNDNLVDRPEMRFWQSQVAIGRFASKEISDGTPIGNPPEFREVVVRRAPGSLRLPVFNSDFVELELGDKQVEIVQLLLPFSARAVTDYKIALNRGSASSILLIDTSGSTKGFLAPWARSFADHLTSLSSGYAWVILFELDGDGVLSGPTRLSLSDLGERTWVHRSSTSGSPPQETVARNIQAVVGRASKPDGSVPVLLLSGGDMNLSVVDWSKVNLARVVQVTPEPEVVLERTAKEIEGDAVFFPFAENSSLAAARSLVGHALADSERPLTDEDFVDYVATASQSGMLPVLPLDVSAKGTLVQPPAFATAETRWFALPYWTVRHDDQLKIQGLK